MSDAELLSKIRVIVASWPKDDRYFDLAFLLGLQPSCPPKPPKEWR